MEIDRDELIHLPDIVDEIRETPWRFILFCDDLSFDSGERSYRSLKSILEGSIEQPPENVRIYATSNRRHLVPETMEENRDSGIINGELHYADAVEEKISLAKTVAKEVPIIPLSAKTREGLQQLQEFLREGLTYALVGSSGVGKSTLINSLIGEEILKTGEVRVKDSRGRHTTARRD